METFQFERRVAFRTADAAEILRGIPAVPGVFALRGERETDEPYLTRAADLRRRMVRLLAPPEAQSRRLNLRERVAWIEYTVTGSEFESTLVLYRAAAAAFGYTEARRRLRLHTPYFLRMTGENAHPRVYSTNRLSKRALGQTYGPFPSRTAAERYCDAVLDLFKLRRCWEDLEVSAAHPGCAYGEMKKCMAPCNLGCSSDEYAAEADSVRRFFETHGESMLGEIARERERASAEMEFERAAALHQQYVKVKAAASLADELVRPVPELRAAIVQKAASETDEAAVFLLRGGCWSGPSRLSTLGVRAVKEQTSVGSSLFAQPLMLQAVPLDDGPATSLTPMESPEVRAAAVLAALEDDAGEAKDVALLSDHLSLLRRWYYRPEKQRTGEVFLPNADGSWPVRRILNGAARVALGAPKEMAETQRDAVAGAKTKILHEGRPDVERVVAVVGKAGPPLREG
jgi:excinuclease ABC subunit C